MRKINGLIFTSLLCVSTVHGQDTDYYNMSLEDLMEVTVDTASKVDETFKNTPGIITVVTSDDISRYGANNLFDVLRRLPGFDVHGSFFTGESVSIRGQNADNDKHSLLLVNGIPFRETFRGGSNVALYKNFPLEIIDKIEIIRGPGSILYGTNAYSGVLNIKTKMRKGIKILAGAGSRSTQMASIDMGSEVAGNKVSLTGNFRKEDGWDYKGKGANKFQTFSYDEDKKDGEGNGAFAQADIKGYKLNFFQAFHKESNLGTDSRWPLESYYQKHKFLTLSKDYELGKGRFHTNLTYHALQDYNEDTAANSSFEMDTYRVEMNYLHKFSNKVNLLFGGEYTTTELEDMNKKLLQATNYWKSIYFQTQATLPFDFRLTLGGQYNAPKDEPTKVSPRVALTKEFTKNFGMKFLYSDAYRSANHGEKFVNNGAAIGNRGLAPETIQTYDIQFYYIREKLFSAITFYQSKEDESNQLDLGVFPFSFRNYGEIKHKGVELEAKYDASTNLRFEGSFVAREIEQVDKSFFRPEMPNVLAKIGASYNCDKGFRVGIFNSYFNDYNQKSSEAKVTNPDSEAYNHLSLNLDFRLHEMFKSIKRKSNFTLYLDNILEDDPQYAPDFQTKFINTLPIRPGRAIVGKLSAEF